MKSNELRFSEVKKTAQKVTCP